MNCECGHPVERHTAFWGGCKYCECLGLPHEEKVGLVLNDLGRMLLDLKHGTHFKAVPDTNLKKIVSSIEKTLFKLSEQGYTPRYRECEDPLEPEIWKRPKEIR